MQKEQVLEMLKSNGVEINDNVNVDAISQSINGFATSLKDKAVKSIDKEAIINDYLKNNNIDLEKFKDIEKTKLSIEERLEQTNSKLEQMENDLAAKDKAIAKSSVEKELIKFGVKDKFIDYTLSSITNENGEYDLSKIDEFKNNNIEVFNEPVEKEFIKITGEVNEAVVENDTAELDEAMGL